MYTSMPLVNLTYCSGTIVIDLFILASTQDNCLDSCVRKCALIEWLDDVLNST